MPMLPIDQIDWKVIKKARELPSYFCEKLLGMKPYFYQVEVLDSKSQFKIMLMARQLGKTQTLSFLASHKINMFPGSQVGIIAQNEKRAKEIYNAVRALQRSNPLFEEAVLRDLQSELVLDNGSRVLFFASGTEGKSIRGATLDLLLKDEGDFIPDAVYSATFPTVVATDGDIVLASTPNMKYSMFYNLFMDGWDAKQKYNGMMELDEEDRKKGILSYEEPLGRQYKYEAFHYDYTAGLAVINPRTGKPQTSMQLVTMFQNKDYHQYEREFLAWWSEESGTFITPASLAAAKRGEDFHLQTLEKFYVMGLDFGRVNDYTAIVILEMNTERDAAIVVDTYRVRQNDWSYILAKIFQYAGKWSVSEMVYDANNLGDLAGTILASQSGQGALFATLPVKMSLQKKTHIYQNMKIAMNTGRLMYQATHIDLMIELAKLLVEETISGMMKIHAPPGDHDDLADALALAASSMAIASIEDNSPINILLAPSTDNYEEYEINFVEESGFAVDSTFSSGSGDFKPEYGF